MIVRAANWDEYDWIAKRANLVIGPAFRARVAIDANGKIHGMVGFDGWTENAVCLHIALDNPAALRSLVHDGFRIAFNEAKRGIALVQVIGTNKRSLRLVEHLGFRPLCRVRDGWAKGLDMCWFEMRREECRWLGKAA